ncbi:MAG: aminotransferase class V-fold PLP-dependent enzyme [Verrucomicrobia bacterium]|nr:aminotransferase class V-fold PLP-dependent enzyme [Verrucomicrobiota bacterium]
MITPETRARDFPALAEMIYLNTAAESIPPLCVGDALQAYWWDKLQGMKGRDAHYARFHECREAAARLLQLSAAEVSFCSCSAEAYNLLATALKLESQDQIVISNLDFPSGTTPWLAPRTTSSVRLWKARDGQLAIEDLIPLLNERTRLAQVSLVSFYNGHRLDWQPFVEAVRTHAPRAIITVDVTQAFGRVVLDCAEADCLISSTHKWILGIHGGCVVAIPQRRSSELTTQAGGWFHLLNAFESDRFERAISKAGAASFSVGMPNFAAIYALNAALCYIASIGTDKIAAYADPLVAMLYGGLIELGLTPMSPWRRDNASGIVSFQHAKSDAIHAALERERINVMHHAGRLRVSVHGYNTRPEIEMFLKTLGKILLAV